MSGGRGGGWIWLDWLGLARTKRFLIFGFRVLIVREDLNREFARRFEAVFHNFVFAESCLSIESFSSREL
jgi:hypothetical protein